MELAKPKLYTLVVNERSGGGRAGKALPKVVRAFHERIPTAEVRVVRSTSWPEAEALTRSAALTARPGDALVVMGGDGMVHLGLNAAAGTDATLGIIPAGTGNDFARAIGVPGSIRGAVDIVVEGHARRLDLSRISNPQFPERYVGAVVSSGYDARVNRATNNTRLRFGALSYGWIAMRELAGFSPLNYRLTIDGQVRELDAMLVAVANTGTFGGGMRIAPDADPADGLLDVTIIHPVPRWLLLRMMPEMYSGRFTRLDEVEQLRAGEVRIEGPDLFCMGDGEELGDVPVTVRSEPGVLKVFMPREN